MNIHGIKIGMKVLALKGTDYAGLQGYITEIRKGSEKETENTPNTLDIYVDFEEMKFADDVTHPHLKGTSIHQVIMDENELAFYLNELEKDVYPISIEGMYVCLNCFTPLDYVTETQYDDLVWTWDEGFYTKGNSGGSEGKRCPYCNVYIEDFQEKMFPY